MGWGGVWGEIEGEEGVFRGAPAAPRGLREAGAALQVVLREPRQGGCGGRAAELVNSVSFAEPRLNLVPGFPWRAGVRLALCKAGTRPWQGRCGAGEQFAVQVCVRG